MRLRDEVTCIGQVLTYVGGQLAAGGPHSFGKDHAEVVREWLDYVANHTDTAGIGTRP